MSQPTYRAVLGAPQVSRIVASMLLSRTAQRMWAVGLVLFILIDYHSPILAGLCASFALLPGMVASPFMGALLDRHDRNRLVIADFTLAASVTLVIAFLGAINHLPPPLLVALVGVSSITNSLSNSGMRAALPLLLPPTMWDRANGIDAVSSEAADVIGPALAGILIATAGTTTALLVIALGWFAAAVVLVGVSIGTSSRLEHAVVREAWDGLRYVVGNPTLRGTALSIATANLSSGALTVCLPLLVFARFGGNAGIVGVLWAISGSASAVAGVLVGRLDTLDRERPIYVSGIVLSGIGIALVAVSSSYAVAILGLIIVGTSSGPINIAAWAMRQRRTDPRVFGRVLAISMSLNFCGYPIGTAIAGFAVHWSVAGTLYVSLVAVVAAAVMARYCVPATRDEGLALGLGQYAEAHA